MTGAVPPATAGPLGVDAAELDRCVSCGLCLPHCPTWRVTGREAASPRGRITAMRAVQWDGAPLDDAFGRMMEECVQCRGCEPVCPAFVPFGHLMEGAREALHHHRRPRRRRLAEWLAFALLLPRHRLLLAVTWCVWALQRLRLLPRSAAVPGLRASSLRRPLEPSPGNAGEPVVLFPGCVMDAWMRDVHRASQRVVEAAGGRIVLPGRGADCCGALHAHAGRMTEARHLASRVVEAMPGTAPVVVDSAGCAAAMKDYGRLLATPEAAAFSARVRDAGEWLSGRDVDGLVPTGEAVVVQDPCHLRHVQRVDGATRDVLARAYEVRETDDAGLCCGAGGAYAVLQPELAVAIRDRKVEALRRAGAPALVVASANPGCIMHLTAGGLDVRHPVELLAHALRGSASGTAARPADERGGNDA